ncbi:hypothetical protein GCM10025760_04560 [Microbacterium yannicii]|uniref:Uncharacterized protein n=1 Tax=Microbacterium yannicii TaxID=671622 RepID=A0ABP9LXN7_9MICO
MTTAEMETFMIDVSTTSTNIAMARRMARRPLKAGAGGVSPVMDEANHPAPLERYGEHEDSGLTGMG